MSVRVKCDDVGCDKCLRGLYAGQDGFERKQYYCKIRKSIIPKENAKDCNSFRCKGPDEYYCKTCRGGK